MKKRLIMLSMMAACCGMIFAGCGSSASSETEDVQVISVEESEDTAAAEDTADTAEVSEDAEEVSEDASETAETTLEDGVYQASFNTDSSMFHVNEAYDGKGTLTVEDGKMTIHVTLVSERIVNLFVGTKEDAQKDGAELLQPTVDHVTYDDGYEEDCYGFDIPVPYLDKEFDLALIGTEGTWYDHKVSVSDVVPADEAQTTETTQE